MSSPSRHREKFSLCKRLFKRKSTRIGCAAPENTEESVSCHSRPSSPDTFVARISKIECISDSPSHFQKGRPQSMIENSSDEKANLILTGAASNNHVIDIPIASVSFDCEYNLKERTKEQSLAREIVKNNMCKRRLSVEQLMTSTEHTNRPHSPDDKSGSLDRKTSRRERASIVRATCRTGSADSLARHSLLAAQVLRLIPVTDARHRNFLQGPLASNSLLGMAELEHLFPGREVTIFVGTWNMNGETPPRELNDFILPREVSYVPDLYAIGTQESYSERQEWEVAQQEVIGPSHLLLHSAALGTLHLSIFIRRDLIWYCSLPEDSALSVRPGAAFRTKGAVGVSFSLFGSTFLFVTAHLTPHQEKVKERLSDIKRIVRALDLPRNIPIKNRDRDVTNNFDYVFWFGDLNFRLGEPRDAVLKWIKSNEFPLPSHLPHGLLHADQLTSVLDEGAAFRDFQEAPITFPPTYKYDPGGQQFDTSSKRRAPAYTDRILYKTKTHPCGYGTSLTGFRQPAPLTGPSVRCTAYNSVPSLTTSDHKPVWALFSALLRPGTNVMPLAAGLFNREVYLEGIKRRAAILDVQPGTSAICNIQ